MRVGMRPGTTPIKTGLTKLAILLAAVLGIFISSRSPAQSLTNAISPADPIGSPDYTPAIRDTETVNLSSGDLSLFAPAVSLPQRNGSTLTIGYYHNAFQWRGETDISADDVPTSVWNGTGFYDGYYQQNTYTGRIVPTFNSQFPFDQPLQINLPTLSGSIEYAGDSSESDGTQTVGFPTFCDMNWVFTDWEGNMHPFPNARGALGQGCNINVAGYFMFGAATQVFDDAYVHVTTDDSQDMSFYHIDLTNPSDIVVTDKGGVKYHFTTIAPMYPNPVWYVVEENSENAYSAIFSSMVDPNGNTVTVAANTALVDQSGVSDAGYTLTDTTGKQVNIMPDGVSYKDSSGALQYITLTQLPAPQLSPGQSQSDTFTWPDWACFGVPPNPPPWLPSNPDITYNCDPVPVGGGYFSYELQFPIADGQHARSFVYTFDGLSRVVRVSYPSGGYTRYDYTMYPINQSTMNVPFTYSTDMSEVHDKYECPSSSGSCSSEAQTQYNPAPSNSIDNGEFNFSITVTDPMQTKMTCVPASDSCSSKSVVDANGNLRETTQSTYAAPSGIYSYPLPATTIETIYTVSGPISYTKKYQYQPLPSAVTPYSDNVTEIDEYNFNGSPIRSTTNVWNSTGIYSFTSANHILDRISTSKVTDYSTTGTTTTTYGYDSYANVTSKAVAGSDGSSATTTYRRNASIDPYNRVTSVVDPGGNITSYSYSDLNWSNNACAPSANSYAYLTSVTNAKSQTRYFTYNSCTGTPGGFTDANGNTTVYAYDALGRTTAVCYPDANGILWSGAECLPKTTAASIVNTYNDGVPNSVAHSVQAGASAYSIQTQTTFDGYARPVTSLLSSDPEGADETDTTYDALGRVASVSNPYRTSSDATYGITSYGYDWSSRKTKQLQSDGVSTLYWCYEGLQDVLHPQPNCVANTSTFTQGSWVDSTDEVGNHMQYVSDALGRLRAVMEPNPSSGTLALETDYTYNGLGNLTNVNQKGASGNTARTRTFSYDTFSRLISSSNPETGTISYSYKPPSAPCNTNDQLGDVTMPCSKIDVRSVTTTYTYDSLNRLASKSYSGTNAKGTPSSCYQYDSSSVTNGIGRLSNAWTESASAACSAPAGILTGRSILAYDAMGRILKEQQCTPSNCANGTSYTPAYTYDLAGNLITSTSGVGPTPTTTPIVLTYTMSSAGRLQTLTSNMTGNWIDGTTWPSTLFSTPATLATQPSICANSTSPTPQYAAFGGLMNATFGGGTSSTGPTLNRAYDKRLRTTCEIDTGAAVTGATSASATVTVTGAEQTK